MKETVATAPTSVGCGMTDAKLPDAQYGLEKAITYALAAHAGANRLCEFGGMLGSLMGCSFEAMVIDEQFDGMLARTLRSSAGHQNLSINMFPKVLRPGIHQRKVDGMGGITPVIKLKMAA